MHICTEKIELDTRLGCPNKKAKMLRKGVIKGMKKGEIYM